MHIFPIEGIIIDGQDANAEKRPEDSDVKYIDRSKLDGLFKRYGVETSWTKVAEPIEVVLPRSFRALRHQRPLVAAGKKQPCLLVGFTESGALLRLGEKDFEMEMAPGSKNFGIRKDQLERLMKQIPDMAVATACRAVLERRQMNRLLLMTCRLMGKDNAFYKEFSEDDHNNISSVVDEYVFQEGKEFIKEKLNDKQFREFKEVRIPIHPFDEKGMSMSMYFMRSLKKKKVLFPSEFDRFFQRITDLISTAIINEGHNSFQAEAFCPIVSDNGKAAIMLGVLERHLEQMKKYVDKNIDQCYIKGTGLTRLNNPAIIDFFYPRKYAERGESFLQDMKAVGEMKQTILEQGLSKKPIKKRPTVCSVEVLNVVREAEAFWRGTGSLDGLAYAVKTAKSNLVAPDAGILCKELFQISERDLFNSLDENTVSDIKNQIKMTGRYNGHLEGRTDNGDVVRYLIAPDPNRYAEFVRFPCEYVEWNFCSSGAGEYELTPKDIAEFALGNGRWLENKSTGEKEYVVYDIVYRRLCHAVPYEEAVKTDLLKSEKGKQASEHRGVERPEKNTHDSHQRKAYI